LQLHSHTSVTLSPQISSSSVNLSQCLLATSLSAFDLFMTITLYKSVYLLTYLKCTKMHHFVNNLIKTTAQHMQDFQIERHHKTFSGRALPGFVLGA